MAPTKADSDFVEEIDHTSVSRDPPRPQFSLAHCEPYQAMKEHRALSEVISCDVDPNNSSLRGPRQRALARVVRLAIDMDLTEGPRLVETLRNYLETYDGEKQEFSRMEDYARYRLLNSGFAYVVDYLLFTETFWSKLTPARLSSFLLRWGMRISTTHSNDPSVQEYENIMGNIAGLTNDYFSWNVEKDQATDRPRNGVNVLMKEHAIDETEAKQLLLGIIVQEESKALEIRRGMSMLSHSRAAIKYCAALELFVGGSCYWHATAPRYQSK